MTINQIITTIGVCYNIMPNVFYSRKRDKKTAEARQVAMYVCRELSDVSLEAIGFEFNRDHATVIYACHQVEKRMTEDVKFKNYMDNLLRRLSGTGAYYSEPQHSFTII